MHFDKFQLYIKPCFWDFQYREVAAPVCASSSVVFVLISVCLSGLLQSPGKGIPSKAATDREGKVLQSKGRKENQRSWRSLCFGGINNS